jgi:hypothetical protein
MVQFPQSGVGHPLLYISRDEWRVQAHYLFLLALNLWQRQASVIHDGDCTSIVDVLQTSLMCKL